MDEFAQTRGSDDLFDDDFTPLAASDSESPVAQPLQKQTSQATPPRQHFYQSSVQTSTHSDSNAPNDPTSHSPVPPKDSTSTTSAPQPSSQPRSRTPVRGDRHLTGGIAKPKLTEEELSAKLAAAKLNSAKRAEAHRLAEADEADFQAREARVQQRRQEEGRARRIMDMERERNRIRKLGAKGGREWDEGKDEVQASERGRGVRRGISGGAGRGRMMNGLYTDGLLERDYGQERGNYEFRGRGKGRNRGRGTFQSIQQRGEQRLPNPVQDFPTLPAASKPKEPQSLPPDKAAGPPQGVNAKSSWADQVAEAQNLSGDRR